MERADINGITLAYEVSGQGEPVVLIHGALIADMFRPLLTEPVLTSQYRCILVHRRGYAGSTCAPEPASVTRHAADVAALLGHLGVERAHVAGHSYGGSVALQLALDSPHVVHSLALLEPGMFGRSTGQAYRDGLARGEARFREAGAETALDEFLSARGPGYRDHLDQVLPGAFTRAVTDAETWFARESPLFRAWDVGAEELQRVTRPALSLLGGESHTLSPRFGETHQLLLQALPSAEAFVLPGATHFMLIENPRGVAEALASFFARHPFQPGSLAR